MGRSRRAFRYEHTAARAFRRRRAREYAHGLPRHPRRTRALATLLGLAIGLTAGNVVDQAIDRAVGQRTIVTAIDYAQAAEFQDVRERREDFERTHAVVGLGGYGQLDARDALNATAVALKDYGMLYDLRYNPKGLDVEEAGDALAAKLVTPALRERGEKVYVTFLGLSTGGKFAVELADYLHEHYGEQVVPSLIIAVSSPYEADSTLGVDKQLLARASSWMAHGRFYVGPMGRTAGQVFYQFRRGDGLAALDLPRAWREAAPKPYDLQLSQLHVVSQEFPVAKLRRLRDEAGLRVLYLRATRATDDTTVDVAQASRQWRAAYGKALGFQELDGPVGHAQLYLRPLVMQRLIAPAMSRLGAQRFEQFAFRELPSPGRRLGGEIDDYGPITPPDRREPGRGVP